MNIPAYFAGLEMLNILQTFLGINGAASFWHPENHWLKFGFRIGMMFAAGGLLKWRGQLPEVSYPRCLLQRDFWVDAWTFQATYALLVGIEGLGAGYALEDWLFFTFGSVFLWRSSHLNYEATRDPNHLDWRGLNRDYALAGAVIIVARVVRALFGLL